MSETLSTIIPPAVAQGAGAFSRLFTAGLEGIARYFVGRAAIACLRGLDDRSLHDIGLVRSQIEAAVHGFMTAPEPGEPMIMISSPALQPAIGSRTGRRGRVSIMEASSWS